MQKTVETHLFRKFTVQDESLPGNVIFTAQNTHTGEEVAGRVFKADAVDLGTAILEVAGKRVFTYEGRLPSVDTLSNGSLSAVGNNPNCLHIYSGAEDPEVVDRDIKALLAIRSVLVDRDSERKAALKAKAEAEKKLNERRDALVNRWAGTVQRTYSSCTDILKNAVDDFIELEDKQK